MKKNNRHVYKKGRQSLKIVLSVDQSIRVKQVFRSRQAWVWYLLSSSVHRRKNVQGWHFLAGPPWAKSLSLGLFFPHLLQFSASVIMVVIRPTSCPLTLFFICLSIACFKSDLQTCLPGSLLSEGFCKHHKSPEHDYLSQFLHLQRKVLTSYSPSCPRFLTLIHILEIFTCLPVTPPELLFQKRNCSQ